jgi:hypothetical protein
VFDAFDKFINDIHESYNSPVVDIRWIDKDGLVGLFIVSNIIYKIQCNPHKNNIWTFKFMRHDIATGSYSLNLTKTNPIDKMSILGTVRKGMRYLIDEKKPSGLIFSTLDDSPGRKKLYTSYSNEIVKEYNYSLRTNLQDNKMIFILHKNIDIDLIIDVIGEFINEI